MSENVNVRKCKCHVIVNVRKCKCRARVKVGKKCKWRANPMLDKFSEKRY